MGLPSFVTPAPYWAFVSRFPAVAAFGFLTAAGSSFGQTFFIGVFGPGIQAEFGLSHTAWGTIYLVGTLGSAALLPWTGKHIDRVSPRTYALTVWLGAGFACAYFAVVWSPIALVLGIMFLRQAGQGLMTPLAITTMARRFEAERGRAIALTTLGFSAGQAVLPFLAVVVNAALGWRWSYVGLSVLLLLGSVPVTRLLRARRASDADGGGAEPRPVAVPVPAKQWSRREVLRDARFYWLLPGVMAPSIIITALFFHHLTVADAKGWSHAWMTGSYVVYALTATVVSLLAGSLVDRYRAVRLVPWMLLPQAAALVVIAYAASPWMLWPYLMALAACNGVSHTALPALWAELYGVRNVGAIRALAASLSVVGSALGPVLMGVLTDVGVTLAAIMLGFASASLVAAGLMRYALRSGAPGAH